MADEIKVDAILELAGTNVSIKRTLRTLSFDQTTERYHAGVQTIGTGAHEALALGDVGTAGWIILKNLEAEGGNFVEVGIDSGASFYATVKLEAQEAALFRCAAAPYAQANTGAVELEFIVLAD